MIELTTKLSDKFIQELKNADEIWVAVALINYAGLKLIQDQLSNECKQNYLVGIDLPTDPKALKLLYELQSKTELTVRVYSDREYFHPKLYLFRKGISFSAFIGSGNCTNGGLNSNVELAVHINDIKACLEITNWFDKLYEKAKPVTSIFISKYQEDYNNRLQRKKEDEKLVKKQKKNINEENEIVLIKRGNLIKKLKGYRNLPNYAGLKKEKNDTINDLRKSLDYPNFTNINIDKFFSLTDLGHILSFPKPTIKKEIDKFRKLLMMLCDETKDIIVRYNKAFEGDFKIRGINEGMISKILIIHKPDLYYVKNGKTNKALNKYGMEFPGGLSKGQKYKGTCDYLIQICKETNIDNLAILDNYLYLEGNDLN